MIEYGETYAPKATPEEPLRDVHDGLADAVSQARQVLDYIQSVNSANFELALAERARNLDGANQERLIRRAGNEAKRQQAEQAYRIALDTANEDDAQANQTADDQKQTIETVFLGHQETAWLTEQAITDTHGNFRRLERDYVITTGLQMDKTQELCNAESGLATLNAQQATDETAIEETGVALAQLEPFLETKAAEVRAEREAFHELGNARVALSHLTSQTKQLSTANGGQSEAMQEAEALVENSAAAAHALEQELGKLDAESRRLSGQLTKITIGKQKRGGSIKKQETYIHQLQTEINNCVAELESLGAEILASKEVIERIEIEPVTPETHISHEVAATASKAAETAASEAIARPAYTVVPTPPISVSPKPGHGPSIIDRLRGHIVMVPDKREVIEMEQAG